MTKKNFSLGEHGIAHLAVLAAVVLITAIVGTFLLVSSHAFPSTPRITAVKASVPKSVKGSSTGNKLWCSGNVQERVGVTTSAPAQKVTVTIIVQDMHVGTTNLRYSKGAWYGTVKPASVCANKKGGTATVPSTPFTVFEVKALFKSGWTDKSFVPHRTLTIN